MAEEWKSKGQNRKHAKIQHFSVELDMQQEKANLYYRDMLFTSGLLLLN